MNVLKRWWRSVREERARVVVMRSAARSPRFGGGDNWGRQLSIGHVIDWLDGRPDEAEADGKILAVLQTHDEVARAAGHLGGRLTGMLPPGGLMFTPHNDHWLEHGVLYHAGVAGHMADDELPAAEQTYRRLLAAEPACLSGLVNRAEIERRGGRIDRATHLLERALSLAETGAVPRHRVSPQSWLPHIRCALARLGATSDPRAAELLPLLAADRVPDAVDRLKSWKDAALAASAAFARADRGQRIALHAAMRLVPCFPRPLPAEHASFDDLAAAERLVRRHAAARVMWSEPYDSPRPGSHEAVRMPAGDGSRSGR